MGGGSLLLDLAGHSLRDALGHGVVFIIRRILAAPGVVPPVDDREFVVAFHEDRSVIPAPRLVTRDAVVRNVWTIADGSLGDGLDLRIADVDLHALVWRKRTHHFA